jgi:hypothetical protein
MADGPGTLLDQAMPAWDVAEHHQRRVAADLDTVWAALLATPMSDLPVTRALMRVRTFGRGSPGSPARTVVEALPPGEITRQAPRELLLGLVAPVRLRYSSADLPVLRTATVAELQRPLPDGWVRIATDFRLVAAGAGTTTLSTDTRVLASGPRAKRAFRAYWLAAGWGSGLVRRELLRAVARRAEAGRG